MPCLRNRERREREKSDMRAAIVDAAYSLVEEGGPEAVSIRAIAERIEYSLRTIYLYFRDKEAILDAVRDRAFRELSRYLEEAGAADYAASEERVAVERLKRLGRAYLSFASERSHLFAVMYFRIPHSVDASECRAGTAENSSSFSYLSIAVADYLGAETADPERVRAVAFALWGMVHGLATLVLFEQEKEFSGVDVAAELERALGALLP